MPQDIFRSVVDLNDLACYYHHSVFFPNNMDRTTVAGIPGTEANASLRGTSQEEVVFRLEYAHLLKDTEIEIPPDDIREDNSLNSDEVAFLGETPWGNNSVTSNEAVFLGDIDKVRVLEIARSVVYHYGVEAAYFLDDTEVLETAHWLRDFDLLDNIYEELVTEYGFSGDEASLFSNYLFAQYPTPWANSPPRCMCSLPYACTAIPEPGRLYSTNAFGAIGDGRPRPVPTTNPEVPPRSTPERESWVPPTVAGSSRQAATITAAPTTGGFPWYLTTSVQDASEAVTYL